jgi:hypothetical protein
MAMVGMPAYYPQRRAPTCLPGAHRGIEGDMNLSLLLIVIGIVLAVLVNYALGIVCILIGLVLLIWPRLRTSA